jgi:pimeloyl-ACP methyl ester carboxylesterase
MTQHPTPEQLADSDSFFATVNNINLHYKLYFEGKPVKSLKHDKGQIYVLLHGFGSGTFSWKSIISPLSQYGPVLAFDRPAFGLTERKLSGFDDTTNPYKLENAVELMMKLIDTVIQEPQQLIVIGHSMGAMLATAAALRYPQRISKLVLVCPAVFTNGPPAFVASLANYMPLLYSYLVSFSFSLFGDKMVKGAYRDPSKLSPELLKDYKKPLQIQNWEYALIEFTKAAGQSHKYVQEHAHEIQIPTLVIQGEFDTIVKAEDVIKCSKVLPKAQLHLIKNCGHCPQEELPSEFMQVLLSFIGETEKQ